MSDTHDPIDLRAELARIDRDRAETGKLLAEQLKFSAEQLKLRAEAEKLTWERWASPTLAIAAVFGGLLGAATFIARVMGH